MEHEVLVSGNNRFGLSAALSRIYSRAVFASRSNGFDLKKYDDQARFAEKALEFERIVICSALSRFSQTLLLERVFEACRAASHKPHIVVCGSTIDRYMNGNVKFYKAEKRALREYCNTLSINGVWGEGPKVSLISFGTLSNNAEKHPDRVTMDIDRAAEMVRWVFEQPKDININEISIDPMQGTHWTKND